MRSNHLETFLYRYYSGAGVHPGVSIWTTRSCSRASTPTGPNMPIYALSSIYSIYTATAYRYPQLLASPIAGHTPSARLKPPHSGAPITGRAAPCLPSCHAPSPPCSLRLVAVCLVLALRAVPRPSPGRGAADDAVPDQEAMPTVDVDAAATLDLISRHREIRSG